MAEERIPPTSENAVAAVGQIGDLEFLVFTRLGNVVRYWYDRNTESVQQKALPVIDVNAEPVKRRF